MSVTQKVVRKSLRGKNRKSEIFARLRREALVHFTRQEELENIEDANIWNFHLGGENHYLLGNGDAIKDDSISLTYLIINQMNIEGDAAFLKMKTLFNLGGESDNPHYELIMSQSRIK